MVALFCKPIGVTLAVTLQQAVGFQLAEIVTELVEDVVFGGEVVDLKDGLMNLLGRPARQLGAGVQKDLHQADHARIVDLDPWEFSFSP